MLRNPFCFLEAFKRCHKICKAKEKRIAMGKKPNTWNIAGREAEQKRWVVHLAVNVAIDDVLKSVQKLHIMPCVLK